MHHAPRLQVDPAIFNRLLKTSAFFCRKIYANIYLAATASISINPPMGRLATCKAVRAGKSLLK